MANMIPISTVTVGSGGASTIEFNNIPQIYTDLKILLCLRSSASGTQERFRATFNGSTSDYTLRWLGNAAGSAVSYTRTDFGDNHLGYMGGASSTSNTFNNTEIYIPNYTSSNNKSISVDNVMENNSSTVYFGLLAGLWSNTSPISSFIITGGQPFVQYSSATLYGIRKY